MSSNLADSNVNAHQIPWPNAIEKKLFDIHGVVLVEDLKLLESTVIEDFLADQKHIVRARAKLAWKELGNSKSYDFRRVVDNIPIGNSNTSSAKKSKPSASSKNAIHRNNVLSVIGKKSPSPEKLSRQPKKRNWKGKRERESWKRVIVSSMLTMKGVTRLTLHTLLEGDWHSRLHKYCRCCYHQYIRRGSISCPAFIRLSHQWLLAYIHQSHRSCWGVWKDLLNS